MANNGKKWQGRHEPFQPAGRILQPPPCDLPIPSPRAAGRGVLSIQWWKCQDTPVPAPLSSVPSAVPSAVAPAAGAKVEAPAAGAKVEDFPSATGQAKPESKEAIVSNRVQSCLIVDNRAIFSSTKAIWGQISRSSPPRRGTSFAARQYLPRRLICLSISPSSPLAIAPPLSPRSRGENRRKGSQFSSISKHEEFCPQTSGLSCGNFGSLFLRGKGND